MTSEIKTLCDEAESLLKGLRDYLDATDSFLVGPAAATSAVSGTRDRFKAHLASRRLPEIVTIIRRVVAEATELGRDMLCDGDGWRYLRHDETVREGDEFLDTSAMSFGWKPTRDAGEKAGPGMFYRRRVAPGVDPGEKHVPEIDPGKGWRLVKPGEILREGDEWLDTTGKTRGVLTASVGRVLPFAGMTCRRRVEASASVAVYIARLLEDTIAGPVVDWQMARRLARDLREHLEGGGPPPDLLTDEEVKFLTNAREFPFSLPLARRITARLLWRLAPSTRPVHDPRDGSP